MAMQDYIHNMIKEVCPIDGISFGKLDDNSTWRIHFNEKATEEQKQKAKSMLNEFIWNDQHKENDRINQRNDKYKDDLLIKQGYINYKITKPDDSFSDYLNYLETL
jgi:hypothetical protein